LTLSSSLLIQKVNVTLCRISFLERPKISQMEAKVVSQDSPKLLDRMRAEIRFHHVNEALHGDRS
jgi:hypothetical protein